MELKLKNGGRTMMVQYQKIIKAFVTSAQLNPVAFQQVGSVKAFSAEHFPLWLKYGGMVGPHLHLGDKTYILNDEQWNKFSKELIADFKSKLDAAKAITFEDAVNIHGSISMIG
jgi:hypothetical protein